ncbi:MAG: 1-acyl-sn-glycerol-3-phosphate acyltransferase [bacterium]|nr:1-acyl-sn-glycerol-3-phosphate acyltransferase [bacterium]
MLNIFKRIFYLLILKPLVYFCLGLNIRNAENIPKDGPCIIVSNHNSHLDTIVLMTLFPTRKMLKISPIAAADYFLANKIIAWISTRIFNIIPLSRKVSKTAQEEFYHELDKRLKNNSIVILYPEGSRGEPDKMMKFKSGIAHIAKLHPDIPIIPVYIEGLGMALPRGEAIFVPAICTIIVEKAIYFEHDKEEFMEKLKNIFDDMQQELVKEEI